MTALAPIYQAFVNADVEALVTIAAAAQLVLEQELDTFCRDCKRRLGVSHEKTCAFYEPDDVVREFDCASASDLVAKRLIDLRQGRLR